jgi:hypothetical protein
MPPPAGSNNVIVAYTHSHPQQYHAGLPFAMNDYEIPGMAIFPGPTGPPPGAGRQFNQYNYPQEPIPGPTRSYPAVASYTPAPDTPVESKTFGPVSAANEPQPPPAVAPVSGSSLPPALSSLPQYLQSATPFRRSKWEDAISAPLNGTPSAFCQTSIFKK